MCPFTCAVKGPSIQQVRRSPGGWIGGGRSAAPAVNAQYVHWHHPGSTRLITDGTGAKIGHWKYYPFGLEAETSGGADIRMKFTVDGKSGSTPSRGTSRARQSVGPDSRITSVLASPLDLHAP